MGAPVACPKGVIARSKAVVRRLTVVVKACKRTVRGVAVVVKPCDTSARGVAVVVEPCNTTVRRQSITSQRPIAARSRRELRDCGRGPRRGWGDRSPRRGYRSPRRGWLCPRRGRCPLPRAQPGEAGHSQAPEPRRGEGRDRGRTSPSPRRGSIIARAGDPGLRPGQGTWPPPGARRLPSPTRSSRPCGGTRSPASCARRGRARRAWRLRRGVRGG